MRTKRAGTFRKYTRFSHGAGRYLRQRARWIKYWPVSLPSPAYLYRVGDIRRQIPEILERSRVQAAAPRRCEKHRRR